MLSASQRPEWDPDYGSQPCHQVERDPSKPIPLDEHIGAVPEEEQKGNTECLTCGLTAWCCVCRREGA